MRRFLRVVAATVAVLAIVAWLGAGCYGVAHTDRPCDSTTCGQETDTW